MSIHIYVFYLQQKLLWASMSGWNSKGSSPFHEKSNVFYRNHKCDDGHLTSMSNIMVHGNREKRNNNKFLLEKVTLCFISGVPRPLSLGMFPSAEGTHNSCSNIQDGSWETCLPEHKLQIKLKEGWHILLVQQGIQFSCAAMIWKTTLHNSL